MIYSSYSAQPASAYPAVQTAYVQPAHQTYATAAPRTAQTYDTYPSAQTSQYAYARTQVDIVKTRINCYRQFLDLFVRTNKSYSMG